MNRSSSSKKRKLGLPVQEFGFLDEHVESSDEVSSADKDSENDREWFDSTIDQDESQQEQPNSATKRGRPKKCSSDPGDLPFISEYERIRLQNIAERNALLKSMGINVNYETSTSPTPSKTKVTRRYKSRDKGNPPLRMSLRSKNKSESKGTVELIVEEIKAEESERDTRNLGSVGWDEQEMEGRESFLEDLKMKMNNFNYDSGSLDLASCTQECFRDVMLSMVISDTPRVVSSRVQSLCIHPSVYKKIVFAGSKEGSLGIWDADKGDEDSHVELHPSTRPINCITTDHYNANEIYLTSHDGTLVLCDISTKQFVNIYATAYEDSINHLTWHNQIDANTFLVCHGNGSVLLVDKRAKSVSKVVQCFHKSARTVQISPSDSNYFLVASGAMGAGCGIFDLRNKKQVSHLDHSKGLTSAFFSPSSKQILSTCNDDTVKIWDSQNLKKIIPKVSVAHNNHTGRWLSVFKAQWYPGRDDIFHIGSLMLPRRIQMFTSRGKLLTELRSDELMVTVQPVIAVHNTLPFIVGGNSSGRLHAFVPPI